MRDNLSSRQSIESLKKEAKRWLHALRANDARARRRFENVIPDAPASPSLRDVQFAIAREHGFPGWTELKEALLLRRNQSNPSLA